MEATFGLVSEGVRGELEIRCLMNNPQKKEDMITCTHWRDCNVDNGGCCAINKYSKPSIAVCLRVCTENVQSSQGLGDTIAKTIERVTRGRVKPKVGKEDCGCNKRRKLLNRAFPYNGKEN